MLSPIDRTTWVGPGNIERQRLNAANGGANEDTAPKSSCVAIGLRGLETLKNSDASSTKTEKGIKKISASSDDISLQKTEENDENISETSESNSCETQPGTISKMSRAFWIGMGCLGTYNLIDAGLARFFALETLTHGTGPLGYMGISLNGADPNYGGGNTGSSVGGGTSHYILKYYLISASLSFENPSEV